MSACCFLSISWTYILLLCIIQFVRNISQDESNTLSLFNRVINILLVTQLLARYFQCWETKDFEVLRVTQKGLKFYFYFILISWWLSLTLSHRISMDFYIFMIEDRMWKGNKYFHFLAIFSSNSRVKLGLSVFYILCTNESLCQEEVLWKKSSILDLYQLH